MRRLLLVCLAACHARGEPALPRAGSLDDDGTGALARVSRGQRPGRARGDDRRVDATDPFGGDLYGGMGGDVYGGFAADYPPYTAPPAVTAGDYAITGVVESGEGGAIEGVVTWKGARPPARLPGSPRATVCPGAFENRSLLVAPGGGVAGAVVYLDGIKSGKAPTGGNGTPLPGATLDVSGCRLAPRVILARAIGALLRVVNHGDTAVGVRFARGAPVPIAAGGLELRLLEPQGVLEVSVDQGHPAASAWVVVPAHPYYVLSDDDGRFRLDDIPAGDYTLVVWHPPVVTGVDSAGEVIRSAPIEVRRRVRVGVRGLVTQRIELR